MRTTISRVVGVSALVVLTGCGGSKGGGGSVEHPSALVGTVGQGDAFTILLDDPAGKAIGTIAAGTYQLTVHDDSSIHNFHITGAGVDDKTSVTSAETKTFTLNLTPGTYTFLCDIHPTSMKGTFKVK